LTRFFVPSSPMKNGGWAPFLAWPEHCFETGAWPDILRRQEKNLHAAPAIAPVMIGNTVPQIGTPASAGGDETFRQMLRSVHEADEAATSPGASDDQAMVIPKQVAQPSSGPPPAMAALLSSSSQGTKPARFQSAVSFANAARDGIVGPTAATAPGLGKAAAGAGAVPAAPLTPLPEAFAEVPVSHPQAVAISGAPETGASAFALPAEAAGFSAAGDTVVSSVAWVTRLARGAAPAKDAAISSTSKINLHLPAGSSSAGSATTAAGSTSWPHAIPAQTVVEADTGASSLNPISTVSKSAVSALPRFAQSSPDVGTPAEQRSASSPKSGVGILAASTPAVQTPIVPAAVAPTPAQTAALRAASTFGGPPDSISPTYKSPAMVGPTSIGLANAVPTSVVPAAAVRPTAVPAALPGDVPRDRRPWADRRRYRTTHRVPGARGSYWSTYSCACAIGGRWEICRCPGCG
jgi:hypothetical protein